MTTIWRLNIKPDAEKGIDPRMFCIERNILGIGWPVDSPVDADTRLDWDAYYNLGMEQYYNERDKGWWPGVNAIHNRMKFDDLCWTRDWDGNYYLGRIEGGWEYRSTPDYLAADIVNVRPCRWFRTGGVDSVPGKVLNSFRAGRTVQAVDDKTVSVYSRIRYNRLSKEAAYNLPGDVRQDLFALIWPEDCEDIVGIYLQEKHGYRLIPSSCKLDTDKTEFILKTAEGKQAYVQVKQGNVDLNADEFKHDGSNPHDWYLFTMYRWLYIQGGTMTDKHSIAETRRNLPSLVREAEKGKAVKLTRRGEPVAVLMGWQRFERLVSTRRSFVAAYRDFTNESDLAELALDPDYLFAGTRQNTPGRDVRL